LAVGKIVLAYIRLSQILRRLRHPERLQAFPQSDLTDGITCVT
jgi:hypothetical protein